MHLAQLARGGAPLQGPLVEALLVDPLQAAHAPEGAAGEEAGGETCR